MNAVSGFITEKFIAFEIISKEDEGIYQYGTEQGLFSVVNIATSLLIGVAFNMVWQTGLFLVSYIMVRKYAGGFHSSTSTKCYFLSSFLVAFALYLNTIFSSKAQSSLLFLAIAMVLIWVMSPVEDLNKPLDEKEKQMYAQKARRGLLMVLIAAMAFWIANLYEALFIISLAMIILALMLVIGRIKNLCIQHKV